MPRPKNWREGFDFLRRHHWQPLVTALIPVVIVRDSFSLS